MISETMPNIGFEDLDLIKRLKGELFDEEFYQNLKAIKFEFNEPTHMLRFRLPDSTTIHFRTIMNSFFNVADVKWQFEFISEASVKAQSKYLFGEHAPSLAKALFRCLNTDGDGKVDFHEFQAFMHIILEEHQFKSETNRWVKLLFNMFDKDEDGVITWDDLTEMAATRMYKIDHMLTSI